MLDLFLLGSHVESFPFSPAFGPAVRPLVGAVSTCWLHQASSGSLGPQRTSTHLPTLHPSACCSWFQSTGSQLPPDPSLLSLRKPWPLTPQPQTLVVLNKETESRRFRAFSASILWKNSEVWASIKWLHEALWILEGKRCRTQITVTREAHRPLKRHSAHHLHFGTQLIYSHLLWSII